jgi:kinesin family member 11
MASYVHGKTALAAEAQVQHLDTNMAALNTLVDRIQEHNDTMHVSQEQSFTVLATKVKESYINIGGAFTDSFDRVQGLCSDASKNISQLGESLPHLDEDSHIRKQLAGLRERVGQDKLEEYIHTGETPTRREYRYPTLMPRTSDRATLIEHMRKGHAEDWFSLSLEPRSPSKTLIFTDNDGVPAQWKEHSNVVRRGIVNSAANLRELDINKMNKVSREDIMISEKVVTISNELAPLPSLKRQAITNASEESKAPSKKRRPNSTAVVSNLLKDGSVILADKEKPTMPNLSASVGHGAVSSLGRRLRSRNN